MAGLILKLAPFERVLLNGAIIENSNSRSRIKIISPNCHILRLRDAIHPKDASTPVSRACYKSQLLLIGELDPNEEAAPLIKEVNTLSSILIDNDSQALLRETILALKERDFYKALRNLRLLLPIENKILTYSENKS